MLYKESNRFEVVYDRYHVLQFLSRHKLTPLWTELFGAPRYDTDLIDDEYEDALSLDRQDSICNKFQRVFKKKFPTSMFLVHVYLDPDMSESMSSIYIHELLCDNMPGYGFNTGLSIPDIKVSYVKEMGDSGSCDEIVINIMEELQLTNRYEEKYHEHPVDSYTEMDTEEDDMKYVYKKIYCMIEKYKKKTHYMVFNTTFGDYIGDTILVKFTMHTQEVMA